MTLGTATSWNQATATTSTGAAVNIGANGQAGFAQTIALYSGNQQTATVGSLLPTELKVICKDKYGNLSAMAQIAWTVVSGGGAFTSYQSATVQGVAVQSLTLGTAPSANTATATIEGTNTSYTFTETGVVGPPAIMSISSGNYQHGEPGVPLANPLVAQVTDAYGNPLSGVKVHWTTGTAGDTLSQSYNSTDTQGYSNDTLTMGPAYGVHNVTAVVAGPGIGRTYVATHGVPVNIDGNPQSESRGNATLLPGVQLPKNLGLCRYV